jgi:hypothetical protein
MEMVIVMLLIAAAFGITAFPLAQALRSERYARGVDGVTRKIMFAAEVMLDFHTDVSLILEKDPENGEFICHITAATPLPIPIEKGLNHHPKISGIEAMAFNHEPKTKIELFFDGTLGEVTKGILTLIAPGKQEEIILPGYPTSIKRGMHAPTITSASYPEEIVSVI